MLDNTLLPAEHLARTNLHSSGWTARKTTRDSLISTWRTKQGSRTEYEGRAAHHVDLKVRFSEVGPALLECLKAADEDGKGYVLQHMLQHVLMVRFGILLGAVELECLKAEWQVLDPVSQRVDYNALVEHCRPGTLHEYVGSLRSMRHAHSAQPYDSKK